MNVGDVVYLKNDPAKLVVESINGTEITVFAHDPNGFLVSRIYPSACLQTTDPTA